MTAKKATTKSAPTTNCHDDSNILVLVTEFILLYLLGTPSFRQRSTILIAIKPERILEPFVERCSVGGMSLTLSVVHDVFPGGFFNGDSDQLLFPAFALFFA